jgi:glycosyltransferase involved in cell wall biosynthesis
LVSEKMPDLSKYVIEIMKDKKLYNRISAEGKRFVKENFDWRTIVAKLNKVYEETKINSNNS